MLVHELPLREELPPRLALHELALQDPPGFSPAELLRFFAAAEKGRVLTLFFGKLKDISDKILSCLSV